MLGKLSIAGALTAVVMIPISLYAQGVGARLTLALPFAVLSFRVSRPRRTLSGVLARRAITASISRPQSRAAESDGSVPALRPFVGPARSITSAWYRSMSLSYLSHSCHGIRYPLHVTACPNHPLQGSGGTVEPLATELPRLGALSVQGR
jgi:hypothetical protein